MSRVGIYAGKNVTFTHRNPQTGEYWTDDIRPNARSPLGMWVDSKDIRFEGEPKRKSRFKRKENRA